MTGTVVVNKEFITLYNQVVDKLGVKALTDEEFYPENLQDLTKCCDFSVGKAFWYGFGPTNHFSWTVQEIQTLQTLALNLLKVLRESGKLMPEPDSRRSFADNTFWFVLPEYLEEWNRRVANVKPLPCRFDDSLLQYVESITLDIETFQSMQNAIKENSND